MAFFTFFSVTVFRKNLKFLCFILSFIFSNGSFTISSSVFSFRPAIFSTKKLLKIFAISASSVITSSPSLMLNKSIIWCYWVGLTISTNFSTSIWFRVKMKMIFINLKNKTSPVSCIERVQLKLHNLSNKILAKKLKGVNWTEKIFRQKIFIGWESGLLYILTRVWVLHTLKAGQNMLIVLVCGSI